MAMILLKLAQNYTTYEDAINFASDTQFDAKGLPKDPLRVFISTQKSALYKELANISCSKDDEKIFKARIENLESLEKAYKVIQKQYMQEFVTKNPDHPNSELYLEKNKLSTLNSNQSL